MKHLNKIIIFLFLISSFSLCACNNDYDKVVPDIVEPVYFRNDGPYIFYNEGRLKIYEVDENNQLVVRECDESSSELIVSVYSDAGEKLFDVPVVEVDNFKRPLSISDRSFDKTFVVSDVHGRFDLFAKIMKAGGVIDADYNWTYGDNHLVIVGDLFDRGPDVLPILWMIYKLEFEAEKNGGLVTTILGDHEELVMRNNLRYTFDKYSFFAYKVLEEDYGNLFGKTSVLGNWLKSKNSVQKVGGNLYVHAGLSKDFLKCGMTIDEINEKIGSTIQLSKYNRRQALPDEADFLYGSMGPLWYRGMVKTSSKYKPISYDNVEKIISLYEVDRVVVGHTENSRVKGFYDGMVLDVCVNHPDSYNYQETRAAVIDRDNNVWGIDDRGDLHRVKNY